MIVIVNHGSGNLQSVKKSLQRFHQHVIISSERRDLVKADGIVLPGVGAFADAMHELQRLNLVETLKEQIQNKPTLGICLGMQLLFETSEESPSVEGLHVLEGTVKRLIPTKGVTIPHTGWNRLIPVKNPIITGHAYFNHSYHCEPKNEEIISAWTLHGTKITAIITEGHIIGTQFHPEKSKSAGDQVLTHFVNLIKQ